MRGDHASGERDVGEVFAIGVEVGVGQVRGTRERIFLSAGGRRPGPAR
jgi:hypothetical protein